MGRYRFINAERDHYPVRQLCPALSGPANGNYTWPAGTPA